MSIEIVWRKTLNTEIAGQYIRCSSDTFMSKREKRRRRRRRRRRRKCDIRASGRRSKSHYV